ncbi:MAG: PEP/pyruvate-binding domain-containing protein, partial [Minisyncoccia bacterium]
AALAAVNHEDMHTVEKASEIIHSVITAASMPADMGDAIRARFKELGVPLVAVRSSATAEDGVTAAWAGQLNTFLNTSETDLLHKVQECWASLFTPRAIFYRFEKGMEGQHISVAVVVQKMVQADVSGVAFSVHPVTEDPNELIIEASYGLGESIVSGQVTPDSYVVSKEPRELLEKTIATKTRGLYKKEGGGNEWRDVPEAQRDVQALTDEQILALSDVVVRIEQHYGFPCDSEWALEDGTLYITQSRPITTLSARSSLL